MLAGVGTATVHGSGMAPEPGSGAIQRHTTHPAQVSPSGNGYRTTTALPGLSPTLAEIVLSTAVQ